ncbi:MAG TPA: hypothetical protein ACFYEB_00455, partial [Candidatus Brocadiia bacterium]
MEHGFLPSYKKEFVVEDEIEGKQYDTVSCPTFSPDSKHVAYTAKEGNKEFVVVDGEEGKQYDTVSCGPFSPDSKHVAYTAKEGNKEFVVV